MSMFEKNSDTLNFLNFATETCGCGRPIRYLTETGLACNKVFRCPTYEGLVRRCVKLQLEVELHERQIANSSANALARIAEIEAQLQELSAIETIVNKHSPPNFKGQGEIVTLSEKVQWLAERYSKLLAQ